MSTLARIVSVRLFLRIFSRDSFTRFSSDASAPTTDFYPDLQNGTTPHINETVSVSADPLQITQNPLVPRSIDPSAEWTSLDPQADLSHDALAEFPVLDYYRQVLVGIDDIL